MSYRLAESLRVSQVDGGQVRHRLALCSDLEGALT